MSGADGEPEWTDGVIGHTRAGLRANRENPVWRLTWGREPASPQRRRRTWIALIAPSAVSLLLFLAISRIVRWNMNHVSTTGETMSFWAGLLTSLLMMPLVLIRRIMSAVPPFLRPESRDELTMVGLSGRDRLWGSNSPGLIGVTLAGLGQAVLIPLFFSLDMHQNILQRKSYADLFVITLPSFLMVTGAFLEAALRGLTFSRLARAAGIALLFFLSGVYSVVTAFICLKGLDSPDFLFRLLFAGECGAVVAVIALWLRAERRLEGPA